jgi:hypothetical protein
VKPHKPPTVIFSLPLPLWTYICGTSPRLKGKIKKSRVLAIMRPAGLGEILSGFLKIRSILFGRNIKNLR